VLRDELSEALLFAHSRINSTTSRTLESSAFLYSLIELLNERGIISIEDLDARKLIVQERLTQRYRERGDGVMVQDPESDKYSFQGTAEIDCASKLDYCRAACCRLPFALSRQDIRERIVQWDLGRPYLIAQGPDNCCVHLDGETKCCTIREQRPTPCRGYDCRQDARIWIDFERNIPNPDILRADWPAPVESLSVENLAEAHS